MELHYHTVSLFTFLQHVQAQSFWRNTPVCLIKVSSSNGTYIKTKLHSNDSHGNSFETHCIPNSIFVAGRFLNGEKWKFYGKFMTSDPGTLTLHNDQGKTYIKISNRGRLRYCSEKNSLLGIPAC